MWRDNICLGLGIHCRCVADLRPDRPCPGPDRQPVSRTPGQCSTPSPGQEVDLRGDTTTLPLYCIEST